MRNFTLHAVYLIFIVLSWSTQVAFSKRGVEQEVKLDGTGDQYIQEKRSVQFFSECDDALDLYWIGDQTYLGDPVRIVDLPPHGKVDMSTFDGHIFYASNPENDDRASPHTVEILPGVDEYVFRTAAPSLTNDEEAFSDGDEENEEIERIGQNVAVDADFNAGEDSGELADNAAASPVGLGSGSATDANTASTREIVNRNRPKNINNGLHPAVTLLNSGTTAMSVKFKNLSPQCDYYYDDGREGVYQGRLVQGGESTTNTYEGHVFFFTQVGNKKAELARFTMNKDQVTYVIVDPESPPPRQMQAQADKELKFAKAYRARTGIHWRHYYGPDGPRPPPTLHMWDAQAVGQIHSVQSTSGHWLNNCTAPSPTATASRVLKNSATESPQSGPLGFLKTLSSKIFGNAEAAAGASPPNSNPSPALDSQSKTFECQTTEALNFEIEVISLEPRAFIIHNFLSAFEADEIVRLSKDKLNESTVGNGDAGGARSDSTRTSKNAWLNRSTNKVIDALFLRAAHVMKIDERLMQSDKNAEDMQVVHYVNGQKYDSHHDWGVSGYPESRFITMLLYLTDQPHKNAGGETSFPKAAGGGGIKVHAGKGNAVLFYNLLEDGNGDDLALHAALPVKDGHEKWLANYWVWDAKRR